MYNDSTTYSSYVKPAPARDAYDALVVYPAEIKALVEQVRKAAGWETGITSEGMKRGGYESRNIDIYGYDVSRNLAVIQIRRAWKKKAGWFTGVSKVYALVGMDGDQIFSHPLESSPRRNPHLRGMNPEDVVRWAESKIFGVPVTKLHMIIRQGDIALVPVRGIPQSASPSLSRRKDGVCTATLRDSHDVQVDGDLLVGTDGEMYVNGAVEIVHTKHEHSAIAGVGRFRIVTGQRADSPWWLDAEIGD